MRNLAITAAGLAILLTAATTALAAGPWTLASGFSTDTNPSGAWSWGQSDAAGDLGSFTAFAWHGTTTDYGMPVWSATTNGYQTGANFWKNTTSSTYAGVLPGEISFHPGSDSHMAVVRWTAPAAGSITVTGAFGAGDLGNVDVHVIKTNGAGIVTGDLFDVLNTPSTQNFNLTTTVTVGSTIDFDLGNADGWSYDNTPLAATITPEPATLTLLALGGAAVVARRRKARS
jgi:hypothetical protein